jgi:hypothetical protein
VIVAGLASAWLAVVSDSGVAPEYRLGLAIGQTLGRICSTAAVGYRSQVSVDGSGTLRVNVTGGAAPPYRLQLRLTHPTRPGVERIVDLETTGKGLYRAPGRNLPAGRWLIVLEDESGIWRLGGEWELVTDGAALVQPAISHQPSARSGATAER